MTDFDAILTGARLPEDRVPVCTRGDLVVEWRRLARELAESKVKGAADPRLGGDGTGPLVERMEALRAEVEASTVEFLLRALPRKQWNELADAHPPRKDGGRVHPDDAALGANRETFLPALVRASTVEPKLKDDTWAALLDASGELLVEQQWRQLWRACWNLNMTEVDVPFSVAGLLTTRVSGSESGSPEPSA
ncbi:hypothetical protein DKT68_15255 [Micromonospora acroterricola]|uniref:Uncharacterized protein n=1 Tax=Micromonospora acroterricola TaxID=2202421 RepID=A0A317D2J0_9ACTN|nr:hypothetical protein [Micromonospora acroterricola]PWR08572.1 hypothetical protein DKT68_15255 [Micromonospora acroterricola]